MPYQLAIDGTVVDADVDVASVFTASTLQSRVLLKHRMCLSHSFKPIELGEIYVS